MTNAIESRIKLYDARIYLDPGDFLDDDQLVQFEMALLNIMRWEENGRNIVTPTIPNFKETLLDHVYDNYQIIRKTPYYYPSIREEIDLEKVTFMNPGHDAGEIIVGDFAQSRSDFTQNKQRHQRREYTIMRRVLLPMIQDPEKQAEARALFKEYTDQQTPEALFMKWVDIVQGARIGTTHFFSNKITRSDEENEKLKIHVEKSLYKMRNQANQLMTILSPESAEEIRVWTAFESFNYVRAGHIEIANEVFKDF